jgi:hypothetical protein
MVSSEQPENEVKTTLWAFLECLLWGPYGDPDQQGDTQFKGIFLEKKVPRVRLFVYLYLSDK